MKRFLRNNAQIVRFGLVGSFNTALDFGILFALKAAGLPSVSANIISSTLAFIFSFFANKKYTFRSNSANVRREFILFTAVTLFGLWVLQSIVIWLIEPALLSMNIGDQLSLLIAKIIATIVSLVWNYLLYSRVVFKK